MRGCGQDRKVKQGGLTVCCCFCVVVDVGIKDEAMRQLTV